MGCKNSTENTELYNKDVNTRHRFLLGVHVSKDPEGIEGNVQLACGTIRKEKYERVPPVEEQQPAQQIGDSSHDNG